MWKILEVTLSMESSTLKKTPKTADATQSENFTPAERFHEILENDIFNSESWKLQQDIG